MFCAHNEGTFIVEGLQVRHLYDKGGTWSLKSFVDRDDLLLQGNYNGLSVLRRKIMVSGGLGINSKGLIFQVELWWLEMIMRSF